MNKYKEQYIFLLLYIVLAIYNIGINNITSLSLILLFLSFIYLMYSIMKIFFNSNISIIIYTIYIIFSTTNILVIRISTYLMFLYFLFSLLVTYINYKYIGKNTLNNSLKFISIFSISLIIHTIVLLLI